MAKSKDQSVNPNPLAPTAGTAINTTPTKRPRVAQPQKGKSVKKQGPSGGQEPGTAVARKQVMERMGARRRIDVKMPGPESPEAYATLSKGRIVRPAMGQRTPFWEQAVEKW